MRIAFVTSGYPPDLGGVEVVVREVAQRLAQDGHRVEVLAHAGVLTRPGAEWQDEVLVRRFGALFHSDQRPVSPRLLVELARRRHDFDIVHAHNFHALPALEAALAHMRPLVFSPHYHGVGHSRAARLAHIGYRPFSRLLFDACAHIVCVSYAETRALEADFPNLRTPVTTIPNGVAIDPFAHAVPFEVEGSVVIAAGRMVPYKQFERVARIAPELPGDTTLVLLGEGPERKAIQRAVALSGREGTVRLLGRVSSHDRHRWFRTASVLVSMSRHESFGLTLVEALAAGIPAVASDIPAHREIAENQPPGAVRLVSPDASSAEIAHAVASARRDGLPARVKVTSWDDVVGQLMEVYEPLRLNREGRDVRPASTS